MKVTIKDISEKSGYTPATVSRALNNNPMVNVATRKKINEIANDLGYIHASKTSESSLNNSTTIGVVVPDITNPYFPMLVKGIQDRLQLEGFNVFLCNSNSDPRTEIECVRTLLASHVRGIIMDPLSDNSYKKLRYIDDRIPVIFTSNIPKGASANYITIDNYAAAQMATEYLISLGHVNIAYIGGNEETDTYHMRFSGYCDTIKKHFSNINSSLIIKVFPSREAGFKAAQKLMSKRRPTAFFASNDSLALGILEYLWKQGYDIPHDISVIGVDDIEYASFPKINLTTVEEPRYQLGQTAAQTMLDLIEATDPIIDPVQTILQPKLVIRNTCAKARKRIH
ncbi:MAG: LacI family DNA-binding transcriptional regulator [Ruminococcus sp.]|jgi:LacI family transcriptional regulator